MDTLQPDGHKREIKQKLKPTFLKEQLKSYFPSDLNALLYALFAIVYLVCAVTHFVHTDDGSMLTTLLPYISAYAGIHKLAHLVPRKEKE